MEYFYSMNRNNNIVSNFRNYGVDDFINKFWITSKEPNSMKELDTYINKFFRIRVCLFLMNPFVTNKTM